MICIFCKAHSGSSKSCEHVIPESLGNSTLVLPPGVVCDGCNNYFARKVEKPLLDTVDTGALRFHQMIGNKRGKIPPLGGTIGSDAPVIVQRYVGAPVIASVYASPEALDLIFRAGADVINLPASGDLWDERLTSRFLAKVALEALAARYVPFVGGVEYIATEPQFDAIRTYARRGGSRVWPYHSRRIYPADKCWTLPDGERVQRTWECDILITHQSEYYFVVALFGLELAINYGDPEIAGYLDWLHRHGGISPLYFGKNAGLASDGV